MFINLLWVWAFLKPQSNGVGDVGACEYVCYRYCKMIYVNVYVNER